MSVHHVVHHGIDFFFVICPSGPAHEAQAHCYAQLTDFQRRYSRCEFRGVALDKLEYVLRNHIDVEPTDAVIFANGLSKALEYGEWPKLVLVLRQSAMHRSFKILEATASAAEIEVAQREYPTVRPMRDGSLWCSRLKEGDTSPSYEIPHGWYVPGDPKEALAALILLSRDEDLEAVRKYFSTSLA